jgi:MarR family transcriptional regulator, multiple antibiotic resistance protein MarR
VKSTSATEGLAGFFDDLVRCETRLYNAVGDKLRAEHGIVASQFEFLRYLRDHPRSRVADVAATFAAGIGAIGKGADRLDARGWVTRLPDPADGRSSLISLTASGTALVTEAERTFNDRLDELIAPAISAGQVDAAWTVLAALRRALEHARRPPRRIEHGPGKAGCRARWPGVAHVRTARPALPLVGDFR